MKSLLNHVIYFIGRLMIGLVNLFPLPWIAAVGRLLGRLAYLLDRRHRRVAIGQLTWFLDRYQLPGKAEQWASRHFQRLGENYLAAIKTAQMSHRAMESHMDYAGFEVFESDPGEHRPPDWNRGWVVAIGHFGNFELYVRTMSQIQGYRGGATYRGLNQPGPDRLLRELRQRSGVQFFDRRRDVESLKQFMREGSTIMGLLADQSTGAGLEMDFLGKPCKCSTAPALIAQRYQCRLVTAICYRVAPARWRIEYGEEIPVFLQGERRSVEAVTAEVNQALEKAVLKDTLNWFWVHDRWKAFSRKKARSMRRSAG